MDEKKIEHLGQRTSVVEKDIDDLNKEINDLSRQLLVYNAQHTRFWQEDWPEIKTALGKLMDKIDAFDKAYLVEGQKTALAIQALQLDNIALKQKTMEQKDVFSDWKFFGATAGSSSIVVGLIEIIKNLLVQ